MSKLTAAKSTTACRSKRMQVNYKSSGFAELDRRCHSGPLIYSVRLSVQIYERHILAVKLSVMSEVHSRLFKSSKLNQILQRLYAVSWKCFNQVYYAGNSGVESLATLWRSKCRNVGYAWTSSTICGSLWIRSLQPDWPDLPPGRGRASGLPPIL